MVSRMYDDARVEIVRFGKQKNYDIIFYHGLQRTIVIYYNLTIYKP